MNTTHSSMRIVALSQLDRRGLLRRAAAAAATGALWSACGEDEGGVDPDADSPERDAGETTDAGTPIDGGVATGDWATGGTASMTAKADYPDPFTAAPAACALVSASTEGPCTTEGDLDREDISEGSVGLPVRLGLRIVDANCAPLPGVTVKLWHTDHVGVYSGNTPQPATCSRNEAAAIAANWFRGVRTTDAQGVAYFDTCYPGWYPGRAVHIHFQVKDASTSYRISQLYFEDALTAEIFTNHPDYSARGRPDTTNTTDLIARQTNDLPLLTLDVAQMTDGAMLATKTIAVR